MITKKAKLLGLENGPIRHAVLPDVFIKRIKNFKQVLAEVDTSSMEDTLDGFKRDANPEKELQVWEKIASAYQWSLGCFPSLNLVERKNVFGVLLGLSMGMRDFSKIKNLSKDMVGQIASYYTLK